jgi:hypothetical protein
MACDRFVYWKDNKKAPTLKDVQVVLEDYVGGAGMVKLHEGRLYAVFHGKPSYPFRRVKGYEEMRHAAEQHDERWMEVFVDKDNLDVITRQTDEFTGAVAEGFAQLAARFWDGTHGPR